MDALIAFATGPWLARLGMALELLGGILVSWDVLTRKHGPSASDYRFELLELARATRLGFQGRPEAVDRFCDDAYAEAIERAAQQSLDSDATVALHRTGKAGVALFVIGLVVQLGDSFVVAP